MKQPKRVHAVGQVHIYVDTTWLDMHYPDGYPETIEPQQKTDIPNCIILKAYKAEPQHTPEGEVYVGSIDIDRILSIPDLFTAQLDTLEAHKQRILSENEQRLQSIEDKISKLKSLPGPNADKDSWQAWDLNAAKTDDEPF